MVLSTTRPNGLSSTLRTRSPCTASEATPASEFELAAWEAFARLKFGDRKSTRLNSSHANISYAVFCLKKKKNERGCYNLAAPRTHDFQSLDDRPLLGNKSTDRVKSENSAQNHSKT